VVRDRKDNCIIICSIENFDPMGVHTGDSITVAPAQTLTDKEYQLLRNASIAVLREIGVDTGGSNVQFGISPEDGRVVVIEMNPRVSRSSALASKATGFPIAKIAAKLAVGYTLDELDNDITGVTPASFEPAIDYVVTKIPRFTFEKFAQADARLTTQMKSVGEVMAIGRTFQESLQKALRGLETGMSGFDPVLDEAEEEPVRVLRRELATPSGERIWFIADAFRHGMSFAEVHELTAVDPWFLAEIEDLVAAETGLDGIRLTDIDRDRLYRLKQQGFSDIRLASLLASTEQEVRAYRQSLDVRPVYRRVDTCAAEFPSATAYMYSTYEESCEAEPSKRRKIMVLGGGPNRIGQGIEFDYCCVHAALAMREDGFETIMVNCNPETVSTDYDTSDRLYFEPVTLEDVLAIADVEQPEGVIVQFGGQTPLKLVEALEQAGVPIIGTSPDAIDRAEDRERFQRLIDKLSLLQPDNRTATDVETAIAGAREIGFPIVVRPSYVLGGRAMEIVYNEEELGRYMREAVHVIEQAGVHSGDSACSLPPYQLPIEIQDRIREQVRAMAIELQVVGLMNVQMAVQEDDVFVLEVNPRASRTVPFVSKCIGVSLAKVAARCMAGTSLQAQGFTGEIIPEFYNVKESVFPFVKFPGVDPILGPEMKSTGEVMGVGETFAEAFSKAALGAGVQLPSSGRAFLSVKDTDKPGLVALGRDLVDLGFSLVATRGTANVLQDADVPCERVYKVGQGRPNVGDMLKNEQIDLIVNTTEGHQSIRDSAIIRRLALQNKVCYTTTLTGGAAFSIAIRHNLESAAHARELEVRCLQELHAIVS
jgi:carbamoyl-phosphate synthase large subunit